MNGNCLILMATYNGEKYIREQLESILIQTYKNWELLIRDDGSKDRTVDIIEEYRKKDFRIKVLKNTSNVHGAYLNFWSLIKYAKEIKPYDYYFFSDQDDIWLPYKVEKMIQAEKGYQKYNQNIPMLIYSDMEIINKNGEQIYASIDNETGIGDMRGFSEFFTHGFIWGCALMINNALFNITPCFPIEHSEIEIMSHDNYFCKYALIVGEIHFVKDTCIKHRRHKENTTNEYKMALNLKSIFDKAVLHNKELSKTHARVYRQTLLTIEIMKRNGIVSKDIDKIKEAITTGGLKAINIMRVYKVHRKQVARKLGIYLIMAIKSYKKYLDCFGK